MRGGCSMLSGWQPHNDSRVCHVCRIQAELHAVSILEVRYQDQVLECVLKFSCLASLQVAAYEESEE